MTSTVYWPTTGIRQDRGVVVGWRIEDALVVVGIVEEWMATEVTNSQDLDMQAIGTAGSGGEQLNVTTGLDFEVQNRLLKRCSAQTRVVLFEPPDPVRLRYFTTAPVSSTSFTSNRLERQDDYGVGRKAKSVGLEQIIPLLNRTRAAQRTLRDIRKQKPRHTHPSLPRVDLADLWVVTLVFRPLVKFLSLVERLTRVQILGRTLKDYSTTCGSATDNEDILTAPADFRLTLHDPTVPLDMRSGRYVKFWNTIWLILNDLLLGYSARELLMISGDVLARSTPSLFQHVLVEDITSALAWLDDWPVGLKLNTPLSRFFRSTFTLIISTWGELMIPFLAAYGPNLLLLLGLTGHGGLTLFLSVLRDVIKVLTLHLRLGHTITGYLVKWQLESLGGLWNLFRGKKWNVLRQRTDSYAYDVDQLFLGTLLFTVSAFLLPTVLTYATLFSAIWAGLWLIDTCLDTFTRALNAFPLFEVLLRIKEPSRLPDGIVFRLRDDKAVEKRHPSTKLELLNAPKSLASILFKPRHGS